MVRAYEILFEMDLTTTAQKFGDKISAQLEKDPVTKGKSITPEQVLEQFFEYDPTPQKKYVLWMIARYTRGVVKFEDMYKVKNDLLKFDKFKSKLSVKDINQIKDEKHLNEIVSELGDNVISKKQATKEQETSLYNNQEAILVFNDSDYKMVIPRTEEASCYFGKNTQWCTAATKSNNQFSNYAEQGDIIVILEKKTNRRWQFHFELSEFRDERDKTIDGPEFARAHPKIIEILIRKGLFDDAMSKVIFGLTSDEDEIRRALMHSPVVILYLMKQGKPIDELMLSTIFDRNIVSSIMGDRAMMKERIIFYLALRDYLFNIYDLGFKVERRFLDRLIQDNPENLVLILQHQRHDLPDEIIKNALSNNPELLSYMFQDGVKIEDDWIISTLQYGNREVSELFDIGYRPSENVMLAMIKSGKYNYELLKSYKQHRDEFPVPQSVDALYQQLYGST